MEPKPCVIIPIYNHGSTIAEVVGRIKKYDLPVILVDDGSAPETKKVLNEISDRPEVLLHALKENQGKGAAMVQGFELAAKQGYTHALQIDADAQHNVEDIPRFIEKAKAYPKAVIAGYPIYDETVPRKRLIGRYITKFWVWVETWSFSIRDSMCGYRLYPLAPTIRLIRSSKISKRMAYDTDIAVRLFWRGVRFENIPTRVTYPSGGLSNFDMLKDNIRISKMHSRLFFGMLWRLPYILLLKLRPKPKPQKIEHWATQQESGAYLPLKILLILYKYFGKIVVKPILPMIIFFYFLVNKNARKASALYLDQRNKLAKKLGKKEVKPSGLNIYRHFYAFGQMMLVKFSAWLGQAGEKDFNKKNPEALAEFFSLLESKQGVVLVGSHLGNIEMLHAFATLNVGLKINGLTYTEHAEAFNRVLKEVNPASELKLIQLKDVDMQTSILLKEKIQQGEVVVITADRDVEKRNTLKCDFLGKPASFPMGPFLLSSILECPVFFIFCVYNGKKYDFYLEKVSDGLKVKRSERKEQLQAVVRKYAGDMEKLCLDYPLQWFNFFDFWQD